MTPRAKDDDDSIVSTVLKRRRQRQRQSPGTRTVKRTREETSTAVTTSTHLPLTNLVLIDEDGLGHYEVERVIDCRITDGKISYQVSWRGYSHLENSYISEEECNCSEKIDDFWGFWFGNSALEMREHFVFEMVQRRCAVLISRLEEEAQTPEFQLKLQTEYVITRPKIETVMDIRRMGQRIWLLCKIENTPNELRWIYLKKLKVEDMPEIIRFVNRFLHILIPYCIGIAQYIYNAFMSKSVLPFPSKVVCFDVMFPLLMNGIRLLRRTIGLNIYENLDPDVEALGNDVIIKNPKITTSYKDLEISELPDEESQPIAENTTSHDTSEEPDETEKYEDAGEHEESEQNDELESSKHSEELEEMEKP